MYTQKTNAVAPVDFVSETRVEQYRHQGFLHIPQVLNPEEVALYLAETERLFQEQIKVSWDEDTGNVMDWIADVEIKSELMGKLAMHPVITRIAEKLAGVDLRLLKSELILKRAEGSTLTPMHIDDFAFPVTQAPNTLTVWIALVDVPVEKGCMTFAAESHQLVEKSLQQTETIAIEPNNAWEKMLDPFTQFPELHWHPRVTVPLRAGDCTIHHNKTLHMAGANLTSSPRWSLATVYTDATALYKTDLYTAEEIAAYEAYQPKAFQGLKNGQLLPEHLFPKVNNPKS